MPHKSKNLKDIEAETGWSYDDHLKHWRSWGSWFSWGSPVGLGLFFLSVAGCIWILSQAFGWGN